MIPELFFCHYFVYWKFLKISCYNRYLHVLTTCWVNCFPTWLFIPYEMHLEIGSIVNCKVWFLEDYAIAIVTSHLLLDFCVRNIVLMKPAIMVGSWKPTAELLFVISKHRYSLQTKHPKPTVSISFRKMAFNLSVALCSFVPIWCSVCI